MYVEFVPKPTQQPAPYQKQPAPYQQQDSDIGSLPHKLSTMIGGSLAQAKRRSSNNSSTSMTNSIEINGQSLMIVIPEPDQEELLVEIARKRTLGLTIGQKVQQVIMPVVNNRDPILNSAQKLPDSTGLVSKLREAIPFELPKTMNGPNLCVLNKR